MIKNILTNLKIEQLNAMQEAAIDTWKEGKDLILLSPTGSGFGYYSLSSIFITEYKGAELGTIALLSNISREIITLLFEIGRAHV